VTAATLHPAKVDRRKEYVSGNAGYGSPRARILSWAIDDQAAMLGDDIYERMGYDPQIRACTNIIKAAVLETGPRITSAVEDKDTDGYAQAKEIADGLSRNLEDLTIPFDDVCWNLMDAIGYGNKIAEQVYHLDRTYTGNQQLVLRSIKVKPRRAIAFVVNPFWDVLGFVANQPGRPSSLTPTADNLLPRDKFAVVTFRPVDSDPRGTSIYRAALAPWDAKVGTWGAYLKFLAQFASPSIWATAAQGASTYTDLDTGTEYTQEEILLREILNFQNGTASAFPFGTILNLIQSSGKGEAFLSAFQLYDQQITKAILHQTLATDEAKFGTRAQASVHQDVLGTIIRQIKQGVEQTIARDIARPWVRYNYGDAALALVPTVTLGDVDQVDFASTASAIASLSTNYLDPSQYIGTDKMLGLPERDPASVARAIERRQSPAQSNSTITKENQNGG
jgi:hypothetical protein